MYQMIIVDETEHICSLLRLNLSHVQWSSLARLKSYMVIVDDTEHLYPHGGRDCTIISSLRPSTLHVQCSSLTRLNFYLLIVAETEHIACSVIWVPCHCSSLAMLNTYRQQPNCSSAPCGSSAEPSHAPPAPAAETPHRHSSPSPSSQEGRTVRAPLGLVW